MHGNSRAQKVILEHRIPKVGGNRVGKEKELVTCEARGHIGHEAHEAQEHVWYEVREAGEHVGHEIRRAREHVGRETRTARGPRARRARGTGAHRVRDHLRHVRHGSMCGLFRLSKII